MAGRPRKTGLSYRSSSTYKYEDFEMVDLLEKYGPLGTTIYDVISDMVLRQGYYLEVSLNTLALNEEMGIRYADVYRCPNCKRAFSGMGIGKYCYHCGQRFDWGDDRA